MLTWFNKLVKNLFMAGTPSKLFIDGNELSELLAENNIPISKFAARDADVDPSTIYNALKGESLKPRSYRQISKAMDRLRRTSSKSKVAG